MQAYGTAGYPRRARVTEIRSFGAEVRSWKRLDTSIGAGAVEDMQTLFGGVEATAAGTATVASKEFVLSLPKRLQKH